MKKKQSYNVIPFIKKFNHISIMNLDDILEALEDNGYLSEKGMDFRKSFWDMFVKRIDNIF